MSRRTTGTGKGKSERLSDGQIGFCRHEFSHGKSPEEVQREVSRNGTQEVGVDVVLTILEISSSVPRPFQSFSAVNPPNLTFIETLLKRGWSAQRIASLYGFPTDDADFGQFVKRHSRPSAPSSPQSAPHSPARPFVPGPPMSASPRPIYGQAPGLRTASASLNGSHGAPARVLDPSREGTRVADGRIVEVRDTRRALLRGDGRAELWEDNRIPLPLLDALAQRFLGESRTVRSRGAVIWLMKELRQGRPRTGVIEAVYERYGPKRESVGNLYDFVTGQNSS